MMGETNGRTQRVRRRWLWLAALVGLVSLTVVSACGEPPRTGPDEVDPRVALLAGVFGPSGGSFEGNFGEAPALQYRYAAPAGVEIAVELTRLDGSADPLLKLYGPRDADGPGPLIGRDETGSNGLRELSAGPLGEGMYIVLVTTRSWPEVGRFKLSLHCVEGCPDLPECPTVASCPTDPVCHTGFELTDAGCPTCVCTDECREDLDCGPEEACRQGVCEERCTCRVPLDPVCGSDGQTYASRCEAACAGVAVASEGECPEICPDLTCDLECPSGYRLGEDGCETCECLEPCEACDTLVEPVCTMSGLTRQNRCLAECRGEQVAYAGPCRPECPDLACAVTCSGGYVRDQDGCLTCECLEVSCPEALDPVCGADGVTYNNDCEADAAGVEVLFDSICPPQCDSRDDCPVNYTCRSGILGATICDVTSPDCVAFCFLSEVSCTNTLTCPAGDVCSTDAVCYSPCDCAPVYDPVCGVDGTDYDNACRARCSDVAVASTSTCCDLSVIERCGLECANGYAVDSNGCEICECAEPTDCVCSDVYNPICGADGVEYANECRMRCAGAGACGADSVISATRICGEDGKVYTAECFMECAGVARCEVPTDISDADKICGEDGRLYANECSMQCAGVNPASDRTICLATDGG